MVGWIVNAHAGTRSASPPNIAVFYWRMVGVSAYARMRDINAERGSLKPI